MLEAVLRRELCWGKTQAREPSSGVSASLPSESGDIGVHCSQTAARIELPGDTTDGECIPDPVWLLFDFKVGNLNP